MKNKKLKPNNFEYDNGSFKDHLGRVFKLNNRVFRTLSEEGKINFEKLVSSGLYEKLLKCNFIEETTLLELNSSDLFSNLDTNAILEHKPISHISYSYEWPFELLKRAALFHLNLHLECLKNDFTIIDGNTFNVQFDGVRPIMIDTPSIIPYEENKPWLGYAQFCEQFLCPLVLSADINIPYNSWLMGSFNGIPLENVSKILPIRSKFNLNKYLHIVLHSKLKKKYSSYDKPIKTNNRSNKKNTENLLNSLKNLILSLKSNSLKDTEWKNYENPNHYNNIEMNQKIKFISQSVTKFKPRIVWDIGCNSGQFSEIALNHGAKYAVGFDSDLGALDLAVSRASKKSLNFLPLYLDILNPTPNLGWNQKERMGLNERKSADMIMALAIIHHLVFSGGVPLQNVINWIVSSAKYGVIEFISKEDPMVKKLLTNRRDFFDDYNEKAFEQNLKNVARIISKTIINNGDRVLFSYERI